MKTKQWTTEKIVDIIKSHRLFKVKHIVGYVPFSRNYLYEKFITDDKNDTIKKELENQAINLKSELRYKWYKSKNPILQMGLMRLLADNEELEALTVTKQDQRHSGQVNIKTNNPFDKLSLDKLEKIKEMLDEKATKNKSK